MSDSKAPPIPPTGEVLDRRELLTAAAGLAASMGLSVSLPGEARAAGKARPPFWAQYLKGWKRDA